jgi:hypothetical protein
VIKAAEGGGMIVTGNGSPTRPYLLSQEDATNPLGNLTVSDDPGGTLDLTISGAGTTVDKRIITGKATQALTGLKDVHGSPSEGKVLVWRTNRWEYETQSGSGTGLPPGGTDGQVLTKQSSVDGDALWESITGGGGGAAVEPLVKAIYQRQAAYSATNTAGPVVVWDTAEQTADGITYNATTGYFTCVTAGLYLITSRMRMAFSGTTNVAAYNQMRLLKNGAIWDLSHVPYVPTGTAAHSIAISRQMQLVPGDTVAIQIVPGGATLTVDMSTTTLHNNSIEISKVPELAPGGGGVVVERPANSFRRHLAATSILNATVTAVPFDNEMNTDGIPWSTPDAAFIAPSDGYYNVEFGLTYAPNATGTRVGYIQVEGVSMASATGGGADLAISGSVTVKVMTGQKIRIATQQSSGASLALNGNANYNWVSVTKVPAAYAGSAVSTYGERNYAASGRNTNNQSIPNNVSTAVVLDSIDYADGITWDGATNEYVVPVAGYYQVNAKVNFTVNTAGYRQMRVLINSASAIAGIFNDNPPVAAVSGYAALGYSRTLKLAAGDRLMLSAFQNSGAALTLASQYTSFDVTKVPAPVVNGAAASGVWGVGNLAGLGSDSLIGRDVYIDSKGQLRTAPLPASLSNLGIPVNCAAEVKFCTDANSTPNVGQVITLAKYTKIGKTVTYWGAGTMGSGLVVNGALFLPPSAGVVAGTMYVVPAGLFVAGGEPLGKGQAVGTGDRVVFTTMTSGAYYDFPAGSFLTWNFTYEVV